MIGSFRAMPGQGKDLVTSAPFLTHAHMHIYTHTCALQGQMERGNPSRDPYVAEGTHAYAGGLVLGPGPWAGWEGSAAVGQEATWWVSQLGEEHSWG